MSSRSPLWYLSDKDNQLVGPFTAEQLIASWRAGQLRPNRVCWCEGMAQWLPLSQTEPFASVFREQTAADSEPSAFKMACPNCNKPLHVAAKALGRTLPCPGCHRPVTVPERPDLLPPLRPMQTLPSPQAITTERGQGFDWKSILTRQRLQEVIGFVKEKPGILAPVAAGLIAVVLLGAWLLSGGSSRQRQSQGVAAAGSSEKKAVPPERKKEEHRRPNSTPGSGALQKPGEAEGLAACGTCAGCAVLIPVLIVAGLALHIALLVWIARDSKARGMDSSVLWMMLVMFTGLIGLIVYLFSRPQGNLLPCSSCGNKRLQASAKCPHCGNA